MEKRKPNFFIVGAPKSGTTSMYAYLRRHLEIYMSPLKEPFYFGDDLLRHNMQRRTKSEYLALFQDAKDEKWLGEASVVYLVSKSAAGEIAAFSPGARILIMLRNPVDMMYSMHGHTLFTGAEVEKDFRKALVLEEARKSGRCIPPKVVIVNALFYRELARYSEQVERYFRTFGRENVHITLFDDFKENVARSFEKVLQFLEVDLTIQPENFAVHNVSRRRRNQRLRQALAHPRVVSGIRVLLPSVAHRERIKRSFSTLFVKEEPRPELDPELKSELQKEYFPEVEQLSALLGCDLTHWCRA